MACPYCGSNTNTRTDFRDFLARLPTSDRERLMHVVRKGSGTDVPPPPKLPVGRVVTDGRMTRLELRGREDRS